MSAMNTEKMYELIFSDISCNCYANFARQNYKKVNKFDYHLPMK